jgi:hypothetical protein
MDSRKCQTATATPAKPGDLLLRLVELFVLKSRTETDARKKVSFILVLISRTNFSRNFVRVLCAKIRDFSAVTMYSNPGKGLKTNKRHSGI